MTNTRCVWDGSDKEKRLAKKIGFFIPHELTKHEYLNLMALYVSTSSNAIPST